MRKSTELYKIKTEFRDVEELCLKWRVLAERGSLPPYEEIGLGSLGRLADDLALIRITEDDAFEIAFCGDALALLFDAEPRGAAVASLPSNFATPFLEALERARDVQIPVATLARRVVAGVVVTLEFVAFPLARRRGGPVYLAFLRERRARYDLVEIIHKATADGVAMLAAHYGPAQDAVDFYIVNLNDSATRIFGACDGGLLWRRLSDAVPAWRDNGLCERLRENLRHQRREEFEASFQGADGATAHYRVSATPNGDLIGLTFSDVTALKQREASFRLLFEHNPMPMWVCDPQTGRFRAVNDAAVQHYSYPREQFLLLELSDIFIDAPFSAAPPGLQLSAEAFSPNELWLSRAGDGRMLRTQIFARELQLDGRAALLMAIVDMTVQHEASARIAHLAHHDDLTGLANRALFQMRLAQGLAALDAGGPALAVLYVDLDGFKYVNDAFGHPIGDKLLIEVASRLRGAVEQSDVVARLGGDEFALLLPNRANAEAAQTAAARIIDAISRPCLLDGQEIRVGASVGVALAPQDAHDADALLRDADIALYRAKRDGRGVFRRFQPEMAEHILQRRELETALRHALAAGELRVHYQPLVDVARGEIIAFEALLRWMHPTKGLVRPDVFIPIAEETGLITPIGEWVLREACHEAARWPQSISVCVNLSPTQFNTRKLPQTIISALAASGLAPQRLELEITESVILAESQANLAALHQIRGLGARISMDDFGTGYSSLNYLRSFPFDKIKVDRSFVMELPHNPECAAIVRAAAGIAECLDIALVAEGVETQAQFEHLRAEGYAQMQGYLYGRPAPADEIAGLVAKGAKLAAA
jgi:diguanylate cyclase (GGDEF)-like protein